MKVSREYGETIPVLFLNPDESEIDDDRDF